MKGRGHSKQSQHGLVESSNEVIAATLIFQYFLLQAYNNLCSI